MEGLGSLRFANSGAAAAQDDFRRGVLLLHSFEYRDAAAAFRRARKLDPDFALAYWGEAMTHNHPVWAEQDRESARAALARYAPTPEERAARTRDPYERAWMKAVDVLYGPGRKATRDTAYARAMGRMVEARPDDFEARAFYALALLGLSGGTRHHPIYMRAAAVALALHRENPRHPGAAHYAIHSVDDPVHAPLGLEAARAYSDIAPEAAHAQHMASHIFLALGLWGELVAANERASDVVDRARASHGLAPSRCGHVNEWLLYGYLQIGRIEDASGLLGGCGDDVDQLAHADDEVDWSSKLRGDTGLSAREQAARSFARMRALYLADRRTQGHTTSRMILGTVAPKWIDEARASDAYVVLMHVGTAFAARRRSEWSVVQGSLDEVQARRIDDAPVLDRYVPIWEGILTGLLLEAQGDLEGAVAEVRRAAEHEAGLPVDYGPPLAAKPPREFEGELLLRMRRPEEALTAFEVGLQRTPRRLLTLLGYARAASAAGREALATDAYRTLLELLDSGDADQEALEEARSFLRRRGGEVDRAEVGAPAPLFGGSISGR